MKDEDNPLDLNQVLNELHAKKRWLDTVIAGLESAVRSPDHRLVESIMDTYSKGYKGRPRVDIRRRRQAKIARLAAQAQKHATRRNGKELANGSN